MTNHVKAEKWIARTPSDVFQALKEGRLFMNCGADSRTMKIDFRVGGQYQIYFKNHQHKNFGEFLEIIPDKKIVFSWCQNFGPDQKPDTQVTIELFGEGEKTRLVLLHSGFKTQTDVDNHQKGWSTGLTDFTEEVQHGRLRMLRTFSAPVDIVYATCKNPESFFAFMGDLSRGEVDFKTGGTFHVPNSKNGVKGEFLEVVPNERIKMSWLAGCAGALKDSHVTLTFKAKDDSSASVEIVHEGLISFEDQSSHRYGWEVVTEKMSEALANRSKT